MRMQYACAIDREWEREEKETREKEDGEKRECTFYIWIT